MVGDGVGVGGGLVAGYSVLEFQTLVLNLEEGDIDMYLLGTSEVFNLLSHYDQLTTFYFYTSMSRFTCFHPLRDVFYSSMIHTDV